MNRATYRPLKPTAAQKAAAHAFYKSAGDDLPMDPLEVEMHVMAARAEAKQEAAGFASDPDMKAAADAKLYETIYGHDLATMRGTLNSKASIRQYVEAGNATVTVVSKATGKRYTLKFTRPPEEGDAYKDERRPIWVKLLNGSDNVSDYVFLGTVWREDGKWVNGDLRYVHSKKSSVGVDAPGCKAARWLIAALGPSKSEDVLAQCEVWHEGRCGRCGRKLTVPSSVESGFGPECITHI